jgi:hypothetical protein
MVNGSWRRVIGRHRPPSAAPGPERRSLHSAVTGFVALMAVAAIVLPLALAGGRPGPEATQAPGSPRWVVAPASVRWASVRYEISGGCGGNPVQVQEASAFRPPGGPQLALVLVRCRSAAELPASSLFVYDGATSATRPTLLATLLRSGQDMVVTGGLEVDGGTVTLSVAGYSSVAVPQCCPDVHRTLRWRWLDGRFVRSG